MIDSLTAKIKRYPFQTGIIVGFILCLLFVGFLDLFQDNGRTLAGNQEIIREDYLRMTIMEFGENRDSQLAGWRYARLGSAADETLMMMRADETISPQLLAAFADAVGKINILTGNSSGGSGSGGTPSSPRKGLSGFGKVLLVILLLIVICAGGLYVASLVKTRKKQKRRSEVAMKIEDEPLNVVTPAPERKPSANEAVKDTLFDLDGLFPKEEKIAEPPAAEKKPDLDLGKAEIHGLDDLPEGDEDAPAEPFEDQSDEETDDSPAEILPDEDEETPSDETADEILLAGLAEEPEDEEEPDGSDEGSEESPLPFLPVDEPVPDEDVEKPAAGPVDEGKPEKKSLLDFEPETIRINDNMGSEPVDSEPVDEETGSESGEEQPVSKDQDAEKPLVETDTQSDPDSEDELLKMIRSPKNDPLELKDESFDLPADLSGELPDEDEGRAESEAPIRENKVTPILSDDEDAEEENLIHYQSTYKIGNDMYDEVFSIDQGDIFRGECGISIGETLNNTEPKAVTAFELWLFDKDDIHTATWYLLSDFALTNEGLSTRLSQKGNCERLRKGACYILETETLRVDVKVLELEYGTEMEEKNSYFTNVTFDVTARSKRMENTED